MAGIALPEVQRLGHDLLSSFSNINNAPALLSILSKSLIPSSAPTPECLLEALLSLQAFFVPLLRSGQISSSVAKKAKEDLRGRTAGDDKPSAGTGLDADAIYKSWLWDKYNEFLDILLQIISHADTLQSLQVAGLDALMEFTRQEQQGKFSNRVYGKLCSTIVQSKDFNSNILELLVAKYFKYFDVCVYTCVNLRKLSATCCGQEQKDAEMTSTAPEIRSQSIMCNICDFLSYLNSPKLSDKDVGTVMESWANSKGENDDRRPKRNDQELEKDMHEKVKFSPKEVKKLKTKITTAWLTYLRLPLPLMVYKKILAQLHKTVIPNLSNPILLSDFLTNSYNKGGVISVMALNGLYVLITQYGLEYPEFYNKLYALLEPSIFVAKYRARFFELLDVCLKSPHLPSYLAAAFAKKLGRMALTSAPAGALIVIAIVYNLLRRHPSINCLVHRDSVGAESMLSNSNGGAYNEEAKETTVSENQGMQKEVAERAGVDPFIATEPEPANCNALKSSLWEVETLRRHYCPAVSKFVASLETDLTVRAKTMELAINDFSSGSYSTIFAEEVGTRMKQVPLAFYRSTPTTLFPNNPVAQDRGEVDFPGWSFGCEQTFHNLQHDSCKFHKVDMNMNGVSNEMHDAGKEFEENIGNTEHNRKYDANLPQKKRQKAR